MPWLQDDGRIEKVRFGGALGEGLQLCQDNHEKVHCTISSSIASGLSARNFSARPTDVPK